MTSEGPFVSPSFSFQLTRRSFSSSSKIMRRSIYNRSVVASTTSALKLY
jgi:hypothetical protein